MKNKEINIGSALICGFIAFGLSFSANNMLIDITGGLWTLEEGAPWIAIYAVFIIPVVFSVITGAAKTFAGIIMSIASPFIVAIADYLICVLIGLFLTGNILNFVVGIILIGTLISGSSGIIIIFF